MPWLAPKSCTADPRCGYAMPCPIHKRVVVRDPFYSSAEWKKQRAAQLEAEPDCAVCGAPGLVADHITPKRFGGTELQTLCAHHHNVKRATTDKRP